MLLAETCHPSCIVCGALVVPATAAHCSAHFGRGSEGFGSRSVVGIPLPISQ